MKTLKDDIRQNALAISVVLVIWILANIVFEHFCPMVLVTGYPCPGCGLTRALLSLIRLDVRSAIQYNPSIFLWIALTLAAIVQRYIRGRSLKVLLIPLVAVFVMTIAIYVWRMIYRFPSEPPLVYEPDNLFAMIYARMK